MASRRKIKTTINVDSEAWSSTRAKLTGRRGTVAPGEVLTAWQFLDGLMHLALTDPDVWDRAVEAGIELRGGDG